MPGDQRELRGRCLVGALYLPEQGIVASHSARARPVSDPANQVPQNLSYKVKGEDSQGLSRVSQAGGGVIPNANPFLGAPNATFVYGGISPEETHPVLNLVKGPPRSVSYRQGNQSYNYNPSWASTADLSGTVGDGTNAPDYIPPTQIFQASTQYPTIPSFKNARWGAETVNTTYNIWRLDNVDSTKVTYRKNHGPLYASGYEGPVVTQHLDADGSARVRVDAPNMEAYLTRVFPMSYDLAYEGAQLYYPRIGNRTISPRSIQAKGDFNCGFHMRIDYRQAGGFTNPLGPQETRGNLRILWGESEGSPDYINIYNLVFAPDSSPVLWFWHPARQRWESMTLQGPKIQDSGTLNVYVHYVGALMLVGFTANPENWNVIYPIPVEEAGKDFNGYCHHYFGPDSLISLLVTNMSCAFTYGPMAFNNFNPGEYLPDQPNSELGAIQVNFSVAEALLPQVDAALLNSNFYAQAVASTDNAIADDDESTPSMQMDWRFRAPELLAYEQTSISPDDIMDEISVSGKVVYYSTIEGPMFHFLRVPPSTEFADKQELIHYFDGWSDITEWVESWTADYEMTGTNKSLLTGRATVRLIDLGLSEKGRQILSLIESNLLTITLGAGYGSTTSFFRGFIVESETEYTANGTITTLVCQDIFSKLIEDIPWRTNLHFAGMKFGRIIEYCIDKLGLLALYKPQADGVDPQTGGPDLWTQSVNQRLGYAPVESPLASELLMADATKSIGHTLSRALQLIVNTDTLPALYLDNNEDEVRLVNRTAEGNIDILKFLGTMDERGVVTLPNSDALYEIVEQEEGEETPEKRPIDRIHGVLSSPYKIKTLNNQLHAGYVLYGFSMFDTSIIAKRNMFRNAWSEAALARLKEALSDDPESYPELSGWVGYRKILLDMTNTKSFPDKLSLEIGAAKIEPILKETYQSISFECYATKPLKHYGGFAVETMLGADESFTTDYYFYRSVGYSFDKNENLIKARIEGEKFPTLIS